MSRNTTPVLAQSNCTVSSPTGSVPARKSPGGAKVTALPNGSVLSVTSTAADARGETFARTVILIRQRRTVVWVYYNFLVCGGAPAANSSPVPLPKSPLPPPAPARQQVNYLADQKALPDKSYWDLDIQPGTISGSVYTRSIVLDPYYNDVSFVEYDLGRRALRLSGVVGARDDSQNDVSMRIEIFVDGNKIFDETGGLGRAIPVDLDVTGALRLRLQATELEKYRQSNYVVFGDIRYTV